MPVAKFIFITPSQYNRIYSASSGILINSQISDDTVYLSGEIKQKDSEIDDLKLAVKELGEELGFYADEKNWRDIVAEETINDKHGLSEGCFDTIIYEDCENDIGGKRAREALSKHKELLEQINNEKLGGAE